MKKTSTIAASFLALGFAIGSFIFLAIEPRMGFSEPSDFFDPEKVLSAAESTVWLVGSLIFLGFGLALAYLALPSDDRNLRASGLIAAVGFFFLGSLGIARAARRVHTRSQSLGDCGAGILAGSIGRLEDHRPGTGRLRVENDTRSRPG